MHQRWPERCLWRPLTFTPQLASLLHYYWLLPTTSEYSPLPNPAILWLLTILPLSTDYCITPLPLIILIYCNDKKIPQLAPHQPSANMAYPPTPPTPSLKIPLASYPPFKHLDVELQMFVSTTTIPHSQHYQLPFLILIARPPFAFKLMMMIVTKKRKYLSGKERVFCCSSPLNWITDLVFQPSNSFKSSLPLLNITHVLSKHSKKISVDWSILPSEQAYIHILLCWVKWVTCEWYPLDCYDCYKEQRCQIQSNN